MLIAFILVIGVADILLRGVILAMALGLVILWMLHRDATSSGRMGMRNPEAVEPTKSVGRPTPYRLHSARLAEAVPAREGEFSDFRLRL